MENSGFAYLNFENNRRGDELLDGLSPADIHSLLYDLFNIKSMLSIPSNLPDADLNAIELLVWTEQIISTIQSNGSIVVSSINVWPKISMGVHTAYEYLPSEYLAYDRNIAFWIYLFERGGVFRNTDGKWTCSKRIEQLSGQRVELLKFIIEAAGYKIDWLVFDGIPAHETGQWAFGITLIMLAKYGKEFRNAEFYAAKYLHFFEIAQDLSGIDLPELHGDFVRIYIHRSFYCFAKLFDLIEIKETENHGEVNLKSSPIFQRLFHV